MEFLISQGCDIDAQTADKKETALFRAVVVAAPDTVKFLLSKGAKHDVVNDEGQSVLHVAAHAGELDVCHPPFELILGRVFFLTLTVLDLCSPG